MGKYGDGHDAERGGTDKQMRSIGTEMMEQMQNKNITTSFHCCGSLLTLSIMAREVDVVQCFLYYNGQMTRFMPKDVKVMFPQMFNMRWNARGKDVKSGNETFVEGKEIDALIAQMEKYTRDKNF